LIWEGHVDYIAKHNREYDMGLHTYTLGINQYADMVSVQPIRVKLLTLFKPHFI